MSLTLRRCSLVLLVVITAAGCADAHREDDTRRVLEDVAYRIREASYVDLNDGTRFVFAPPIRADGSGDDPTGLQALANGLQDRQIHGTHAIGFECARTGESFTQPRFPAVGQSVEPIEAADAWDRALIYRSPGPVHKHGWDLYSAGPNGIDEKGGGDDILLGEDVADVTSGR